LNIRKSTEISSRTASQEPEHQRHELSLDQRHELSLGVRERHLIEPEHQRHELSLEKRRNLENDEGRRRRVLGEVVALLLLLLLLQGGVGECSERLWHCSRRRVLGEVVALQQEESARRGCGTRLQSPRRAKRTTNSLHLIASCSLSSSSPPSSSSAAAAAAAAAGIQAMSLPIASHRRLSSRPTALGGGETAGEGRGGWSRAAEVRGSHLDSSGGVAISRVQVFG